MTRHKIDSAMVRMSHGSEDLPGIAVKKEVINLPKTINSADMLILSLLQNHFNVRIVLFKHSDATPVDIIGTWEDVQFAIHVFHFLRQSFSRCWNEFKSNANLPHRKSYYRGLHDGLKITILEGKKRAEVPPRGVGISLRVHCAPEGNISPGHYRKFIRVRSRT